MRDISSYFCSTRIARLSDNLRQEIYLSNPVDVYVDNPIHNISKNIKVIDDGVVEITEYLKKNNITTLFYITCVKDKRKLFSATYISRKPKLYFIYSNDYLTILDFKKFLSNKLDVPYDKLFVIEVPKIEENRYFCDKTTYKVDCKFRDKLLVTYTFSDIFQFE